MKYPEYCGTYYDKVEVKEIVADTSVTVRFYSDAHSDWIEAWAHTEKKEITLCVGDYFRPEHYHDKEFDVDQISENFVWTTEESSEEVDQAYESKFYFNHHMQHINQVLEDNFADNL